MSELGAALSAELDRIINCPYPASLSGLADILARADALTVRNCIHDQPPCAVSRLVNIVCDALPLWSYTLHVLQYLCLADYGELCVILLSRPLPESVPLPAAAQEFFRIFQHAVQDPKVHTLQPVYCMLDGACQHLLHLLPDDAQQEFDRELRRMLSSNNAGKDSMLLLWCFGVVLLAERQSPLQVLGDSPTGTTSGSDKQWRTSSGQKLFMTTKGLQKTITLTCMSVVWALKAGVGVSDVEAMEGIRVATRVLRYIDIDTRVAWSKSGILAQDTLEKFLSKLERPDLPLEVVFEALSFCALLNGVDKMPSTIVRRFEQCLAGLTGFADPENVRETLSISLSMFASQVREKSFEASIVDILSACLSGSIPYTQTSLIALIEELSKIISKLGSSVQNLAHAISSTKLEKKLWDFARHESAFRTTQCGSHRVADSDALASATIAFLLTAALTSRSAGPVLSSDLIVTLIDMQRRVRPATAACSHVVPAQSQPKLSLFQQPCTPYTGQHFQDWRSCLQSELESQTHYQRDAIVWSVAQICGDLERRCNTVEGPLRQEQERTRTLKSKLSGLNVAIMSLQSRVTDDELHLQGMEDEKEMMEKERCELLSEKQSLKDQLMELTLATSEEHAQAEETLRKVNELHRAQETELKSIILQREGTLRIHESEREQLQKTMSQLQDIHAQKENDFLQLQEQHTLLQDQLRDADAVLADERELASGRFEEIRHMKKEKLDLEKHLQGTEMQLENAMNKLNSLESTHDEFVRSLERSIRDLEARHAHDAAITLGKTEARCADLRSQLQNAQDHNQQSKRALETTHRELQAAQALVSPLQNRAEELIDLCSEQEDELEELRTLRRNVLASMGLTTQPGLAIRSAPRSQGDPEPDICTGVRSHRRRTSSMMTEERVPRQGLGPLSFANVTLGFGVDAPPASSGPQSSQGDPTPRRAKPRLSFKVPTMHTPNTQNHVATSKSALRKLSPSERSVLKVVSPNRRHTIVALRPIGHGDESSAHEHSPNSRRRIGMQDLEHVDLDMDDEFLAGTPMTPDHFMSGTGRLSREEGETITEL